MDTTWIVAASVLFVVLVCSGGVQAQTVGEVKPPDPAGAVVRIPAGSTLVLEPSAEAVQAAAAVKQSRHQALCVAIANKMKSFRCDGVASVR